MALNTDARATTVLDPTRVADAAHDHAGAFGEDAPARAGSPSVGDWRPPHVSHAEVFEYEPRRSVFTRR